MGVTAQIPQPKQKFPLLPVTDSLITINSSLRKRTPLTLNIKEVFWGLKWPKWVKTGHLELLFGFFGARFLFWGGKFLFSENIQPLGGSFNATKPYEINPKTNPRTIITDNYKFFNYI